MSKIARGGGEENPSELEYIVDRMGNEETCPEYRHSFPFARLPGFFFRTLFSF